jgi:hypothetical protein
LKSVDIQGERGRGARRKISRSTIIAGDSRYEEKLKTINAA